MTQTKVSNTFIDNNFPFRNLIINGDMNIAQRGTSTTGVDAAASFPSCDRMKLQNNGFAGAYTVTQTADGPGVFGLTKCFKMACTTADTSTAAAEYSFISTLLETQHLQHLRKGESDAKKLYLSFYAKGDAAVTYVVEVYDNEHDRVQSQTFTISTSWQRFTFEIPADTNGETLDNDNSVGLSIHFWLHAGSNFTSGTLSGSWADRTNANRAVGIGSMLASTSRTFFLTGVQLELGGVSDFEQVPHDVQLQRCKRYYEKIEYEGMIATMTATSTSNAYGRIECEVEKRTDPTVTLPTAGQSTNQTSVLSGSGSYPSTTGSHAVGNPTPLGFRLQATSYDSLETGGGLMLYVNGTVHIEFDAEL